MAVVNNTNSYITRKELTQKLSSYVERSYVLEYIHSELEDSLENLNVYTKNEIDSTLSSYITKEEVQSILSHNNEYYTKSDTRALINSAINAFKNSELVVKLGDFVSKRDLNTTLNGLFYTKNEIDDKFAEFAFKTPENEDVNIDEYINNALIGYATISETRAMINSSINAPIKQLEAKVSSIMNYYATKEALVDIVQKMNESIYLLENTFTDFYSKDEVNDRINFLIKNYCYTREETRQLIQVSIDYFKNNYLPNKLDDYVTKEAHAHHLQNYYTKPQIDEKLASDSFCNIMHLTETSYNLLVKRNQIQENCIYILYKFNRPVSIYIGSLHLAKRNTTGSIGFPYTFPLTF